jgi:WD40 repeat protein
VNYGSAEIGVESWLVPRLLRGLKERCALTTLAFAPDGKTLATGGPDSVARLWEVKTGRLLRTFNGRKGWVSALAFTPDGKTLAGGGYYSSASTCLWDVKTGKLLREFKKHGTEAKTLAFSPDGKQMVVVGECHIDFVEAATGKGQARFSSKSRWVQDAYEEAYTTAVFSRNGRIVAIGSDRGFSLYDATTRKKIRSFAADGLVDCTGIVFTPDGRSLITAYTDGTTLFWDLAKLRGRK